MAPHVTTAMIWLQRCDDFQAHAAIWIFNLLAAKPNTDDALGALLDLRPWDDADRRRYDDAAVLRRLRDNPGGAAVRYRFRRTSGPPEEVYPAFRIVSLGGSLRTVRTCRRAYPEAFATRNPPPGPENTHCRRAPPTLLHAACMFRAEAEVVKYVRGQDPTAVAVANRHGYTPLHCACTYGSSAEVVRLLVRWHDGALTLKNRLGERPLDAAVNNGASEEVIEVLRLKNQSRRGSTSTTISHDISLEGCEASS